MIYFIHSINNVYMSISSSQFIPPLLFPLVSTRLFSLRLCLYFCSVLLNKMKLLRVQAQSLEILELKDCAPEIYPSHTHLCCPQQL